MLKLVDFAAFCTTRVEFVNTFETTVWVIDWQMPFFLQNKRSNRGEMYLKIMNGLSRYKFLRYRLK